ncbi:tetratricopeptide repeat protein [Prochlorococcus marinus]|uniref:O-linked N-acetylglucosamine transferase family protein n=1 Tax=Prochlorococcus marinus TaxID=1219 RepID=UPI0022B373D8|nr:tetratricopeptide repeat protein [Prochlorococcus marinus]
MKQSGDKNQGGEEVFEVTTFTIPFALEETQGNLTINTNAPSKLSNEEIINQALHFHSQGNITEAAKCYQKLINKGFREAFIFSNYGVILKDVGKLKEAELAQRKAIEINPYYAEAHSNLGNILRHIGELKEAELSTRKAIKIKPDYAEAYSNLGNILRHIGKSKEAELSIRKAIEIKPDLSSAHLNLGILLRENGNNEEAIKSQKKALKLNPFSSSARAELIRSKKDICDWSNQEIENNWLENIGIEGEAVNPWDFLFVEDNPIKSLKRSKKYYKDNYIKKSFKIASFKNKKIHLGYFSSDFYEHATMNLIASILELHDKSKFEIYLYSFTPKEDEYTERAKASGCFFRDIKKLNTIESVKLARSDRLDIAIDLKGYTKNNRMDIFSHRVAPIQINYLGYPGSLGADTIDYILSDKIIIPEEYEKFYSEKVIRMPSCYQCNDNKKEISMEPIKRNDFKLPEQGFVFTCFNANRKISPNEFNIWMRLLKEIKGSVLWLYQSNLLARQNLYKEAEIRNVDTNRLIFANKLCLDKHLARYSLGDLGLDTFNCNGHTTTSDALWAGLPVLTKVGESFASRVSASLLTSLGITELITYNESEYEEKALHIARNPEILLRLKSLVANLRYKSQLFNSELFTKSLENKLEKLLI